MNTVLKFVVIAAVICAATATLEEEFDAWAKEYGKKYESEAERAIRMQIFAKNKEMIDQLNARSTSEVYGLNAFADRTMEDLTLSFTSPLPDDMDFGQEVETYEASPEVINALPKSFNWVSKGAVTSVKNQGQCGSCWAFSAVGCMEGQLFLKKNKLVNLSPQNLVDCDKDCMTFGTTKLCDGGCNGGLAAIAFQHVIRNNGINTLSDYPYHAKDEKCKFDASKAVKGFHHWSQVNVKTEDDLRAYLHSNGPVAIGLHADELFYYKSGIFSGDCKTQNNHAVLLTGWGQNDKGTPFWVIKNSWGEEWGLKGYLHLIRGKNKCGMLNFMTMIHI